MSAENDKRLARRVARAAEDALADHRFVAPIDVLCGLGGRLGDLYGRQRMFIVDPRFVAHWEAFLRRLGAALGAPDSSGAPAPHPTDAAAI